MDINTGINTITATILSLERHANERWNNGDVETPSKSTPTMSLSLTRSQPPASTDGRQWRNTSAPYGLARFGFTATR
jgi:hypothetical protein